MATANASPSTMLRGRSKWSRIPSRACLAARHTIRVADQCARYVASRPHATAQPFGPASEAE